jgi:hypothetical protein
MGVKKNASRKTPRRQASAMKRGHAQLGQAAQVARERVVDRLDFQRGAVASALEDVGRGLEDATHRTRSPWPRKALEVGGRVLREASTRLDEYSTEELLDEAGRLVKRNPGWTAAGLLGVGMLAGRLLRASGDDGRD